jgi:hypothetical protein
MSEPVIELIVQDVVDRIAEITTANGYHQTLVARRPIRGNLEGLENPENGVVLVIQGDPEENEDISVEGNPKAKGWTQPIYLQCFVIAAHDDTTTPLDKLVNRVEADVVKKLLADRTRGGHAIDTIPRASDRYTDGPQATGVLMQFDVIYRTDEDDPYIER